MFTWGAKFFFAVAGVAIVTAWIFGLVTGGDAIGVVSAGYKGGVGGHLGYTILVAVSLLMIVLGITTIVTRDGDAEEMAARVGVADVPVVTPPAKPAPWGLIAGFGVACLVVGAAVSLAFWILGLAVLFVAGLQWLVLAWSDRATGDPEVNEIIRARVMGPVEVPMWAMLSLAVIAVGISRVFLAASIAGAVVAGSIVTLVVFGLAVVLSKIEVKSNVLAGIAVVGALAVLTAGIVAAAIGPRDFHHADTHEDDTHEGEGEGE